MNEFPTLRERVMELLSYDALTGKFTWNATRGRMRRGDEAGTVNDGYRRITIDGKIYYAHRLAWMIMTGKFPLHEIDHVDNDKLNNRFENLREATRSENQRNIGNEKTVLLAL